MENERTYWHWAMRRRLSRRQMLKAGGVLGVGAAAGLALVGCDSGKTQPSGPAKPGQTPQAGQPKYGGTLKVGYQEASGYLHPGVSRGGWDPNFLLIHGDSLVYTAPDGSPDVDSSLAASWKKENDTTFTFTLRQGIKFHDGTEYDAQAQKWYFEYLLDPERSKLFGYRQMVETIKEMEVVDKYTLRIRLSRLDPGFLANMGAQAGIPVSPTAIEKLGPDIVTRPAPTGPFVVKSFTPGGEWVFEKNPNYWRKGLPYLDGITYIEIPDDRVRAASLQSGQVDMAWFPVAGDVTAHLKQDGNLVYTDSPAGPTVLNLNHALPPLDNLKLRQAIASSIDKEAIQKTVFQGFGQVAKGGLVQPGHWAYKDVSDAMYKFDLNKAREYVKESGVKTPIPLKMLAADSPADRRPTAELIKGWLEEVGFQINLDMVASAEATRRMLDELSYHLNASSSGTRTDPDGEFSIYSTSTAYWNAGRKSQEPVQKQLDDLVKAGAATYDQKERKRIYDEVQILQTKYVIGNITLVYRIYTVVLRPNVKGTENLWNPAMSTFRARFLWKE